MKRKGRDQLGLFTLFTLHSPHLCRPRLSRAQEATATSRSSLAGHPRVTIGPRFPADMPALDIVKDFQSGIGRLVTDKRLEAGSPFVKELQQWLTEAIRENSPRLFKITAQPTTEFEAEIKAALETSLPKL